MSDVAAPETLGEPLSLDRCKALGFIFHATSNKNWEGIKENGLVLGMTYAGITSLDSVIIPIDLPSTPL